MEILKSIGAGIASIGIFIGSLFGFTPDIQAPEELGRAVDAVATNNYVIAGSGISSSATTIILSSFTTPVSGVPYTMSHFGQGGSAKGYLTIEPGSRTRQEIVSFTGLTQNSDGSATLTGVTRGLLPFEPYTASTTYATAHNGGSQVTVSNPPQLYDAIYDYIDSASIAGAVDGTISAKGIYETATGLEAASTTPIGGGSTSATLVLTTLISTTTSPTSGNVIPVTKSDGNISDTFLPNTTKQVNTAFDAIASSTFTGATSPQPAFTATSSGKLVLSSGATASTSAFQGFVITTTAPNATATVQTSGIVGGFSGLSLGSNYYVQDTAGTIGTSVGTLSIPVGVAISSTEIAIQKQKRYSSGTTQLSATGQTVVTIGFRPASVRIHAKVSDASVSSFGVSDGGWTVAGANDCSYFGNKAGDATPGWVGVTTSAWYVYTDITGTPLGHVGNVTSVTDTGFTLNNTKQSTPGDAYLFWEAYE